MNFRSICGAMILIGIGSVLLNAAATQTVDSGSFGVFVNGRRVATESFTVRQEAGGSVANSEVKIEDGSNKPSQTAETQFTGGGELKRYEWHQFTPSKADAIVTPNEPFLVERLSQGAETKKPVEQPFMLPTSTMVLDNNFFLQRQLLAWRYMASGCRQSGRNTECHLLPAKFGVLVPQALTSMAVTMEYGGREKISVRGVQRELYRLNLKSADGPDWSLWLDDSYKLIRITVAGESTEVVRD